MKVLITGGSGFIGTHLTRLLLQKGYHVEHIGRSRHSKAGVKTWVWDICKNFIEEGAFDLQGFEGFYIIHLAGEGIVDKAWTPDRKRAIISSRMDTISFLYHECVKRNLFPKAVISAGGIAYYGTLTSDQIFMESDAPSDDFIGHCCVQWEKAARLFEPFCPVSILRTPLVLDRYEGGLPMLDRKILGVRPIVGSGGQWMPWIHIHDLCKAYVFCLERGLNEVYNAVAPTHISYRDLIREVNGAGHRKKGFFIPLKVPGFVIGLVYGERKKLVTEGSRVSGQKLVDAGYVFDFAGIEEALADIYR